MIDPAQHMHEPPQRAAGAASGRRVAWVLFGPLAAMVGVRWVLAWLDDRAHLPPAWELTDFVGTQDAMARLGATLWLLLALGLVLGAALWVQRRHGLASMRRMLAALWLLLALAACAAQLRSHLNLRGLQPQPVPLQARVAGVHAQPPSLHSTGGQLLVLQLQGEPQDKPLQALVDDPAARALRPGQQLQLDWARGRFGGRYITGWRSSAAPAPAAPAQLS